MQIQWIRNSHCNLHYGDVCRPAVQLTRRDNIAIKLVIYVSATASNFLALALPYSYVEKVDGISRQENQCREEA